MLVAIADTHTVIWYTFNDARLSKRAGDFLEDAATAGNHVGVSAITLAEMVYLGEKGRIHPDSMTRLTASLDNPENVLLEVPFDRNIALALSLVDRKAVPDLPDRIIAASAIYMGVPVITRDGKIRLSDVETVW